MSVEESKSRSQEASDRLVKFSQYLDESNAHRNPEAVTWGRLAKIAEENGEVIAAYIGATGQNPRKGITNDMDEVVKELLDVTITALGAVEHIKGNSGVALELLFDKLETLVKRAGLE